MWKWIVGFFSKPETCPVCGKPDPLYVAGSRKMCGKCWAITCHALDRNHARDAAVRCTAEKCGSRRIR